MRRGLIIVEPKAHRRLSLVAALRDQYEVIPLMSLDGALRQIRDHRPEIVLIGVGRRSGPCLRLCRQIKTDAGSQAYVGLIDWNHNLPTPEATIKDCRCDGVFSGVPDDTAACHFSDSLNPKTPTIQGVDKPKGLLRFLS